MNDLNPLELICTFLCGKSSSAAAGDECTPAFAEQCCVDRVVVYTMWNQTKWYHDDQRDTVVDFFFHLLNCTVLGVTLTLGLPGNLWVCWLVFKTRSLQTSDNALLVSLAVSDLLKCSVDTPLLLFSQERRPCICLHTHGNVHPSAVHLRPLLLRPAPHPGWNQCGTFSGHRLSIPNREKESQSPGLDTVHLAVWSDPGSCVFDFIQ